MKLILPRQYFKLDRNEYGGLVEERHGGCEQRMVVTITVLGIHFLNELGSSTISDTSHLLDSETDDLDNESASRAEYCAIYISTVAFFRV